MYLIYYQVTQLFTLLTSIFSLCFFTFVRKTRREFRFVLTIEILTYIAFLSLPQDVLLLDGRVPILRYLSWTLTCPILLVNLLHANKIKNIDIYVNVIVLDELTITGGILCAMTTVVWAKICFFVMSSIFFIILFIIFYKMCEDSKMILIFFASWTIFPVLFLLGPECTGAISIGWSLTFHAVGDLLSKNFVGIYINENNGTKIYVQKEKNIQKEKNVLKEVTKRKTTELKQDGELNQISITLPSMSEQDLMEAIQNRALMNKLRSVKQSGKKYVNNEDKIDI